MSNIPDNNALMVRIFGTDIDVYRGTELVTDEISFNDTVEFEKAVITLHDKDNGIIRVDLSGKTIRRLCFMGTLVDLVNCMPMLPQTPAFEEIAFENAVIINDESEPDGTDETAAKQPAIRAKIVSIDKDSVVENPPGFNSMFQYVGCFQVSDDMPFLSAVCLFPKNASMVGHNYAPVDVDYLHGFILENPWCRGAHVIVRNAVEMYEIESLCLHGTLDANLVVPLFVHHDSTSTYNAYWDTYPEFLAGMNAMMSLPADATVRTRMKAVTKAKQAYRTENRQSKHFFNSERQTLEKALERTFKEYNSNSANTKRKTSKDSVNEITTNVAQLIV